MSETCSIMRCRMTAPVGALAISRRREAPIWRDAAFHAAASRAATSVTMTSAAFSAHGVSAFAYFSNASVIHAIAVGFDSSNPIRTISSTC